MVLHAVAVFIGLVQSLACPVLIDWPSEQLSLYQPLGSHVQMSISTEAYLEPNRTSTIEIFCENTRKSSIVDVRLGSKYASAVVELGISLLLTYNCKTQLSLDRLIQGNLILFFTSTYPTCAFGNIEVSFIYKTRNISVLLTSKECRWPARRLTALSTNSTHVDHKLTFNIQHNFLSPKYQFHLC